MFIFTSLDICRMVEDGGDWDRRNRLKVYRALYHLIVRDFKVINTSLFSLIVFVGNLPWLCLVLILSLSLFFVTCDPYITFLTRITLSLSTVCGLAAAGLHRHLHCHRAVWLLGIRALCGALRDDDRHSPRAPR
jgi:hypothetical protein